MTLVMTLLLAVLMAVVGAYLVTTAALAVQSGILIPKSPEHPVLLASQPILFWVLVIGIACVGCFAVYCGWLVGRGLWASPGPDRDEAGR